MGPTEATQGPDGHTCQSSPSWAEPSTCHTRRHLPGLWPRKAKRGGVGAGTGQPGLLLGTRATAAPGNPGRHRELDPWRDLDNPSSRLSTPNEGYCNPSTNHSVWWKLRKSRKPLSHHSLLRQADFQGNYKHGPCVTREPSPAPDLPQSTSAAASQETAQKQCEPREQGTSP